MGLFDRFAERASQLVSRAWFFGFCVLLVVLWAPSLPLFGKVDTWQLVINTATTIITFLLVALLQNSQWRGDKATNEKLDAIAGGLADTMEAVDVLTAALRIDDDGTEMRRAARELRRSVGIEHRLSSGGHDDDDHGARAGGADVDASPVQDDSGDASHSERPSRPASIG